MPDPAPDVDDPSQAPAAPPSAPSARPPTLRESAAFVGSAIWFERRCFELVGDLVTSVEDPRLRAALSTVSRHHAWRADQLESVLARTHDLGPDDMIAPAAGFDDAALARVAAPSGAEDRVGQLVDLLATWVGRLRDQRAALAPIADAPLIRVLDIVVADLERDGAALVAARGDDAA